MILKLHSETNNRYNRGRVSVAGTSTVNCPGVENLDLSILIDMVSFFLH